jgi:hypothetical protein
MNGSVFFCRLCSDFFTKKKAPHATPFPVHI